MYGLAIVLKTVLAVYTMYERVSNRKETGDVMIDKRIGQRIKECRERIGLTQEQFSEKTGLSVNYISTVERGGSFPRCERLITILNGLQVSADAIFCDVIDHAVEYKENELSRRLSALPAEEQNRILQMLDLMIKQAENNK